MNHELESSREREKTVERAFLFDVDGVLTHPSEKRVTEMALFREIEGRLRAGEPIAFNTGRSIDFLQKQLLAPLEKILARDAVLMDSLLAVGEKGSAWVEYKDGKQTAGIDDTVSLPQELQDAVRDLVQQEFADAMFFDTTKRTMISVEMLDGFDVGEFAIRQQAFNRRLEVLVQQYDKAGLYTIDPTRIATDVQHAHVGKALGARRVLDWLRNKGIVPKQYLTFGDSTSDIPMAEEIHRQGLPVELVFVGEKKLIKNSLPFPVLFTKAQCEKGTVEYLDSLK